MASGSGPSSSSSPSELSRAVKAANKGRMLTFCDYLSERGEGELDMHLKTRKYSVYEEFASVLCALQKKNLDVDAFGVSKSRYFCCFLSHTGLE